MAGGHVTRAVAALVLVLLAAFVFGGARAQADFSGNTSGIASVVVDGITVSPSGTDYSVHVGSSAGATVSVTVTAADSANSVAIPGNPDTGLVVGSATTDVDVNSGVTLSVCLPGAIGTGDPTSCDHFDLSIFPTNSYDTTLQSLSVSPGSLEPSFSSGTTSYDVTVPGSTSSIAVTASQTDPDASLTYAVGGNTVGSVSSVTLNDVGQTTTIVVSVHEADSSNGDPPRDYTIVVHRGVANADLSNLTVSDASIDFDSGTTSYDASVGSATTSVTVTPTLSDSNAHYTINLDGTPVGSDAAQTVTLDDPDPTAIDVVVTADDGTTTKTYSISISHLASQTLQIAFSGDGSGLVSISPGALTCPSSAPDSGDCAPTFDPGTSVELTGTPDAGSVFSGFSGAGCSENLSMPSSDLTCTAEFDSLGAAQDGPTYTVTTEDDTDDGFCGVETCSLRDAVAAAQANDGGTIEFAPGVDNVAMTSTITVAGGVTLEIDGNGIATTTINGSGFDTESNGWVFEVDNDTELDLHDLAITGARDNAAYVNGGTLSLDDVDLHDNAATNDSGGGVYVDDGGTLDASGGSIRFNQADHDGGAVFVADGSATLEGVTVTGNVAGDAGGGIYGEGDSEIRLTSGTTVIDNGAYGDGGGGIVVVDGSELALTDVAVVGNVGAGGAIVIATDQDNTLTNVTITINTSDAGLDAEGAATLTNVTITRNTGSGISSGGAVELENSLVAANDDSNCNGTVESLGHNLDDDGSCSLDGAGDLSDVDDARLGALSSGVVPLLSGSPALDAGADLSDGFTDDQRGVSRPQGGAWDIGAYEAAEHKLTLATDGSGSIAADPSPTTGGWYVEGTAVTLTATPADGVTFTGWNADCSDAGPGTVTMSANRSCTATFSDAGAGGGSGGGGSSGGGGTTSGGTTTGDGSASTTITDGTATVSQTLTVAPHLSVTVPAGTLTPGTVVTVTQTVSTGSTGFGADGTVLDLRVTGPGGTRITTFDPPLQLEFPPEPEGWVPGYSEDGKHWTPIPRLSSPSLPAAWPDGYYVQADGSILVFTRHATLFGVLHDTQAPAAPAKPAVTYAKGKLFFSWPAALDNSGSVASYTILRNGKAIRSLAGRQVALVSSAGLFAVVAVDAAGNTSESSPAVTVKLAPRPAAIPKRIPAWAWTMLHRRGNASVPRPAAAPKRLPRWYWSWAAWRQRPFVVS